MSRLTEWLREIELAYEDPEDFGAWDRALAAHDAGLRAETLRDAAKGFRHSADYGYRATRINATEDYLNNLATTDTSPPDAIQLAPDGSNWREVREFLIDQHYAYDVEFYETLTGFTGAIKYTDRFNIRPGQWVTVSSRDRGNHITVTEEDPRG